MDKLTWVYNIFSTKNIVLSIFDNGKQSQQCKECAYINNVQSSLKILFSFKLRSFK